MRNQDLPTFSTHDDKRVFNFHAPTSWQELGQSELRYVLAILSTFQDHIVVKCYMLTRFCGIRVHKHTRTGWKCSCLCQVGDALASKNPKSRRKRPQQRQEVFYITDAEILDLLKNFDFIDDFTEFYPLERIGELQGCGRLLRDITFIDYLTCEKYYQLFMIHQRDEFLQRLGWLLYRTPSGGTDETVHFQPYELLNVFMWYSCVKGYLATNFPHFFKPAKEGGELRHEDIMPAMQAQIRALTDGDVTKLQAVYETACWDALTELDNKAREAEEFKERTKQNH